MPKVEPWVQARRRHHPHHRCQRLPTPRSQQPGVPGGGEQWADPLHAAAPPRRPIMCSPGKGHPPHPACGHSGQHHLRTPDSGRGMSSSLPFPLCTLKCGHRPYHGRLAVPLYSPHLCAALDLDFSKSLLLALGSIQALECNKLGWEAHSSNPPAVLLPALRRKP